MRTATITITTDVDDDVTDVQVQQLLARLVGYTIRSGRIGEPSREYEVDPLDEPVENPVTEPAPSTPAEVPA